MAIIDLLNRHIPKAPTIEIGIGNFTAAAIISERVAFSADAPVTYLEDGSFASDHIILKPLVVTLEGEVSDINLRRTPLNEAISRARADVGAISTYLPTMTQSQIQRANAIINDAQDKMREVDAAINTGKQVASFIGGSGVENTSVRESFLEQIENWHYGKQLISITTEFRLYENMWLSEVSIDRDNQDNAIKFKITAQEVRFADVEYSEASNFFKKPADGTGGKTESVTGKGPQAPESVTAKSLIKTTYDAATEWLGLVF